MSTPVAEYDLKAVRQLLLHSGITELTQADLALIDRLFMIYEGNVQKTAAAFVRRIKG